MPLNYAIIDEVDNILIDEARTPLIISGPAFTDVERYAEADKIARQLTEMERRRRVATACVVSGTEGDGCDSIRPTDKVDPQNPPPRASTSRSRRRSTPAT